MGELSLYVATARRRRHHAAVLQRRPGLAPVAKGNGYGLGIRRLAAEDVRDLPERVVLHATSVRHGATELGARRLVIALGTGMHCRGLSPDELRASLPRLEHDRIVGILAASEAAAPRGRALRRRLGGLDGPTAGRRRRHRRDVRQP